MSLGTWFRDYVYIPLGGNRVSMPRWIFNTCVVWFLTGFWHGADWTFMIWGLYFALFLMAEKFFLNKFFARLPKVFSHIYVVFLILISFVIFSGNGISGEISDVGAMFGAGKLPLWSKDTAYYLSGYALVLILGIIGATPIVKNTTLKLKENAKANAVINILEPIFHVVMLIIVTAYFVDGSFSPFLYFRF
jgi:alginate O-acetyltransferase complex protein AlgI